MSHFLILIAFENCSSKLLMLYNWDLCGCVIQGTYFCGLRRGRLKNFKTYIERKVRIAPLIMLVHRRFRSVVVFTSASHAEGRRFEPGRKQFFSFLFMAFVALFVIACLYCLWTALLTNDGCVRSTVRAAVKTELSHRNGTLISLFLRSKQK